MTVSWTGFIESAAACQHGVQIYGDADELTDAVACYLAAGFAAGDPAIVIATADHRRRFADALEARGHDPATLLRTRMLTTRDAEEVLASFMEEELPSPQRFEQSVGALVDEASASFPGRTIRAFGEMVDILAREGRQDGALALEELWNGLARTRSFALLCAYRLDIFDVDIQSRLLPGIFRTHTHAQPAADPARLAAAVDRALADTVGARRAARIYLDVAEHVPHGPFPRAQAVLMWLVAQDTKLARAILDRARSHYLRLSAA